MQGVMLKGAWEALKARAAIGIGASIALHILVMFLALYGALPSAQYSVRRGEPMMVELPPLPEPPPAGNPLAKSLAPPVPPRPAPARPAPQASPPARPAPAKPAPPVSAPPARPVETPPLVASRPAAPEPPPPTPAVPPPAPEQPALPAPEKPVAAAPEKPVEPAPEPPIAKAPETPVPAPEKPVAPAPEPPSVAGPPAPAPEASPATPPKVAAVPPGAPAPPPPVDIRSALGRDGGAGTARGRGRGGIEGEPIPLDSADPKFNDYLDRLRRKIKANWGFPCVRNDATRSCDYKTATLVVHFGILKDGRLQFVEVVRSSGYPIYDDYAINAIKFSSPFPTVPASMMVSMRQGSTGIAIMAHFNYVVDSSLTNMLR
jgi:TonB family protein